jgi:hypothetical protein
MVRPSIAVRGIAKAELARRIRQGNAFVKGVLAQPKIWLIGGEGDLTS